MVRVSGRGLQELVLALVRALPQTARSHLHRLSGCHRPGHRPWPGALFCRAALLHRRRRAGAAGPWRPGGAATVAGALPGGGGRARPQRFSPPGALARGAARRVFRARFSQRQDRSGAGRGHCRPDRCQHRGRSAQRQPFPGRGLFAGNSPAARCPHPSAHAGRGHARFPRRGNRLFAKGGCAGTAHPAGTEP